jgi:hypothetical protein
MMISGPREKNIYIDEKGVALHRSRISSQKVETI